MPDFQAEKMRDQTIILWAGLEGRLVLEETLQSRGAHIHWLHTYRQEPQSFTVKVDQPSILIAYSARALTFFKRGLPLNDFERVAQFPVIVISQRIAEQAKMLGFKQIVVAQSTRPEAIQKALLKAV